MLSQATTCHPEQEKQENKPHLPKEKQEMGKEERSKVYVGVENEGGGGVEGGGEGEAVRSIDAGRIIFVTYPRP